MTSVPRRSASIRCPHCEAWIDVAPWRRLWAATDLRARLQADRDLEDDLRDALLVPLEERIASMRTALGPPEEQAPEVAGVESAFEVVAKPQSAPAPARAALERPAAPAVVTPKPAARKKKKPERTAPTVWERLGPAFAENLGFGLAAFLILAGAVYFTTTAWTTMTGAQRLLVVVGGLVLLGGVLYGAARLLNRGGNLPEVERTLLLIIAFLVPIAAIPAGNLLDLSLWRALLATVVVLVPGFLVTRRLARVLDPALVPFLPIAYVLLTVPVLFGGPLGRWAPTLAVAVASGLLLVAAWIYGARVVRRVQKAHRWAALWPGILFAFAVAVFGGRVAIGGRLVFSAATVLSTLGIVVAAFGAALVTVEPALSVRRILGRRRPAVLLVIAIALGITGTLMALGYDIGLLVASLFGAYAALRAGLALPVPWFVLPGLVLSALAYLKSPAPVKAAALQLRDQAADALGYTNRPMPLAWYGLTFLPYVFACALTGWAFLRRNQPDKARIFFAWSFLAAIGLSALALFASGDPMFSDLRAPAAVFAAQGGLLLAIGLALRHRWFVFAGALGVFAGATCGLLYLEPAVAVVVLALSAVGLVALIAATVLGTRAPETQAAARAGLLDAAACLALALFSATLVDGLRLDPGPWWHGFGYLVLLALLGGLAFALRRPEGIAFAAVALGVAGARFVVGLAPGAGGDVYYLVLTVLSGVVLVTPRIDALLPQSLRHPDPGAPQGIGSWTPLGALAIQLLGFVLLVKYVPDPALTPTLAAGLLAGALVLGRAATREAQPWPLYPAVVQFVAAGIVIGTHWTSGLWYATGGLGGAAIAIVLLGLPLALDRPRAVVGPLGRPLRHLFPVLAAGFAVWAFGVGIAWLTGADGRLDGVVLAIASLAVAIVSRFALLRMPRSHALRAAALYGGTLFAPAAAGILMAVEHATHAWPLALVGAAGAVRLWSGRDRRIRPPAMLHLLLALGSATGIGLADTGDPGWLLIALLLVAVGGWIVARRLPVPGWLLVLVALLVAVSLPLGARLLGVDAGLQPTIWLLFAALIYLALYVPRLGVDRTAARWVADPILGVGALFAVFHAVEVFVREPPVGHSASDVPLPPAQYLRYAEGALGLAALARSLVLPFQMMGRRTLALFILGLAAFTYAPVNMWIHGADTHFWRPDVELALLAFLLAFAMQRVETPRLADGTGRLGDRMPWPLVLAAIGLLLTIAELRDLSTPLTLLAATAMVFVLLVRDRGPGLGRLWAIGVLVTALGFASWWRPMPGAVDEGILLLYAAVSALVAPLLAFTARRLARGERPAWIVRAAREVYPVGVIAAVLAFAFVIADLQTSGKRQASSLEILLAAIGLLVPGAAALWGTLRAQRTHLIHVVLIAGLLFYTFLVRRTDAVAFLDGSHLHVLVVLGAGLLFLSDFHKGPLGRWLAIDGLALAVPATVRYAPAAVGLAPGSDAVASALALCSISAAAGARRLTWPILYGAAGILVNLVLFAFWRRHGLVDPAFYGVPPGLTLLAAAMLLRGHISRQANLALIVPGLALLYGSVALQVVRADDPLHALILFGLGFLTVVFGFRLRRNEWIVVGVVVIVLDVVLYLLVHGFESGFFGAALLVLAGLVIMAVAALATFRRRAAEPTPDAGAAGESDAPESSDD